MIETRLLQYFIAVAREQNITRAAEALHITQSTLSKQMMELEYQLGKTLFIRGKRHITLTDEGIYLRNRAQEILELMDKTELVFHSDIQNLTGDISIGCGETAAMDEIATRFADFHALHPDVKLHLFSGDADSVLEKLDKGLCDFGLLLGPVKQDKYDYLDIHQKDVFGLLMPKSSEYSDLEYVTDEQLKKMPLIMSASTFSGHHEFESFHSNYAEMNIVATYNLIYNAIFLVERGIGYAVCIDRLVNLQGRELVFVPIYPELTVKLYIVTKKYRTFSPAVQLFIDNLKL